MRRLSLVGAVAATLISCGGGQSSVDNSVPPTGMAVQVFDTVPALGEPLESVSDMALSHDYVNVLGWIAEDAAIYRVRKDGGKSTTVEANSSAFFLALAARNDTVVWLRSAFPVDGDAHPVQVVRQTGGDAPALVAEVSIESLSTYLHPVQLGADTLYMSARFGGVSGFYAVTLESGAFRLVSAFRQFPYHTAYWLVAEPYIYFVEYSGSVAENWDCRVRRVAIDGGTPEDVSACPVNVIGNANWFVGADETDLYMASFRSLWKIPQAGGAATMLYEGKDPNAILDLGTSVLDGQRLYFGIGAQSSQVKIPFNLMSIPKAGGAATLIYNGPFVRDGIVQLEQDESNLFMRSYNGVAFVAKSSPAP